MDPNETLRGLRDLMASVDLIDTEVGELFDALDTWITRGGFLPDAWNPDD